MMELVIRELGGICFRSVPFFCAPCTRKEPVEWKDVSGASYRTGPSTSYHQAAGDLRLVGVLSVCAMLFL